MTTIVLEPALDRRVRDGGSAAPAASDRGTKAGRGEAVGDNGLVRVPALRVGPVAAEEMSVD